MKTRTKKSFIRLTAALMVLTMFVTVFASAPSGSSAVFSEAKVATERLENVTGNYDLDSLKAQYYDTDIVRENEFSADTERWVIVELDEAGVIDSYLESGYAADFAAYGESYIGKKYAADMRVSQRRFLSRLNAKGIEYEYKYSYTTLLNGVAVKVKNKDISAIGGIKGVENVYLSDSFAEPEAVAVSNNANVYNTGIYDSSDIEYKGEGMVVAVLDTGLDFSHPAFSTMPDPANGLWDERYIAAKLDETTAKKSLATSTTVDQVYYNAKVPYAFDYADSDPDVYPSYSTHGTHVAGIVAGEDGSKSVGDGQTFIGVAPQAQLVIMKVFTDNLDSRMLGGADTVDVLAAVSDCAVLGVDVINMSLGSSCGFSDESSDTMIAEAYGKVEEAGISLVVAASNDYSSGYGGGYGTNLASNPDSGTVGSPSTYSAALSVASINGQPSPYVVANENAAGDGAVAFITESSDVNGNSYDFIKGIYDSLGVTDMTQKVTLDYVVVGGVGRSINYNSSVQTALSNGRTIALIRRGDTTFAEKVETAMAYGAVGCIIYNNLSGTIRMSLGEVENPVPTCSIGMDAGKQMVDGATRGVGKVTLSYNEYKAGPFMSDFSSWGPTPDLKLKPEITAHGGEITSAVPGGYDEYSGTSMAAPNMAGAIALLRQFVETEYSLSGTALRARVNQMLMSTATMALNEEGNPYSPRKQGAGLAGISEAIDTDAYITVSDGAGGTLDKTKLELGDDPDRTGKYEMSFTINNLRDVALTYTPQAYVMTETLATDNKTVAERANMLTDSVVEITAGGIPIEGGDVTVPASDSIEVTVTITLSAQSKEYLENSFENGMYVEGFIRFTKKSASVDLGIPFLAFYGDWTDAPLFDYTMYEISENDLDASVPDEDKIKAQSAASTPLGLYDNDQYIIPLGQYLYRMSDSDTEIVASDDRAAISMYDTTNRRTLYELYMVYAGLLRGAKTLDVTITDAVTGEVVYSKTEHDVSKAYAAGGSNRGAPVMLEVSPSMWNLNNNGVYNVSMSGTLDYDGGENPQNNSFDFKFAIDYEAPVISDYRIRFEPYTENRETKYRIYMEVDVFDNQYAQALLPCYINNSDNTLYLLTEYPIPIYSQKGTTTTVTFEVTDIYDDYVSTGELYIGVEDYAMNQTLYRVRTAGAISYPDTIDIATDDKLSFVENETAGGNTYGVYSLTLARNEVYKLNMTVPEDTEAYKLSWDIKNTAETNSVSYVLANESELFGSSRGTATAILYAGDSKTTDAIRAKIRITVSGTELTAPIPERIILGNALSGDGFLVSLDSGSIELNPNTSFSIVPSIEPWYLRNIRYTYTSSNPDVVSVSGSTVKTIKRGTARITVAAQGYERLSKSFRVRVGSDFDVTNYYLYDYYGGEEVVIPDDLNIMYIDEEAFRYNTTIKSIVFPTTLLEIPESAFVGCTNLERIVIPSNCTVIHKSAFDGCTRLREIELLEFEDEDTGETSTGAITVGERAFANCSSLTTIINPKRLTTAYSYAFTNCTSLRSIDISGLRVGGSNVFEGCRNLAEVITDENTYIGREFFKGCTSLASFEIKGSRVNDGAFSGCTSLANVTFTAENVYYLGSNAFFGCTSLVGITLPNGEYVIGESAFGGCTNLTTVTLNEKTKLLAGTASPFTGSAVAAFVVTPGNTAYSVTEGVLLNAQGTEIVLVPVKIADPITALSAVSGNITTIGAGAFAGSTLTTLDLSAAFARVTTIGDYAFAGSSLGSITLPSSITAIPNGAFNACTSLESVTATSVLNVGDYAFASSGLASFNFANVVIVGDYAFIGTKLAGALSSDNLRYIGAHAFENLSLTSVVAKNVEIIGASAFRGCTSIASAELGTEVNNIVTLGTEAFRGCTSLANVTVDAAVVGTGAFWGCTSLETFTGSEASVGDYAFYGCGELVTFDCPASSYGALAFYDAVKLSTIDLSRAISIGEGAFAGCESLTSASLDYAETIGMGAFMSSGLTSVTMEKVEVIGAYAFENTALTTVTLPDTFNKSTYDESWYVYSDSGRITLFEGKKSPSFGAGAFTNISTLTEINVEAGNDTYTSIDGVLYAKSPSGLVLLQFPAGKNAASFTPSAGTVRIADSAFEGVVSVNSVVIPYSVRSIGAYAFYNSSVKNYTFESVEAPVLESTYVSPSAAPNAALANAFTHSSGLFTPHSASVFYNNFYDYVALIVEQDYIRDRYSVTYEAPDFGLTITRPENGRGYDTVIWKGFFSTEKLSAYAADNTTRAAIEAIATLPTLDTIEGVVDTEGDNAAKLAALRSLSENSIKPVRAAYNLVTDPRQAALVVDSADLYAAEAKVRELKETLGEPAVVAELVLENRPDKIRYIEGESFDPTGMKITAVFDDMSEIDVTNYTVDKTVLAVGDNVIVISYGGETFEVYISVEAKASEGGDEPTPIDPSDEPDRMGVGMIVGIVLGCVFGAAILAGAVVYFVIKRRKN